MWSLHSHLPAQRLVDIPSRVSSLKELTLKFFFIFGGQWEYPEGEVCNRGGVVRFNRQWETLMEASLEELPLSRHQ